MNYITRAQWGAQPPRWREAITISKGVFIHYNGPAVGSQVAAGEFNAVCAFLRQIQGYHMNTQGWPDIAYSWAVDATGRIYELRGWGIAGAHTLGWNWDSHGVFLPLGGEQAPTAAQIAGTNEVIAEHNRRFGAGFVRGHQQAPNSTSCPGGPTMARILAGDFNGQPTPPPPDPQPEDEDMKPIILVAPTTGTHWFCHGVLRRKLLDQRQIEIQLYLGVAIVRPGQGVADSDLLAWIRTFEDVDGLKVK
jgi:hypothetical protein